MKKFLIKATAGLFVLSLLIAPVAVFAAVDVGGADSCRTRSSLDADEVSALTGLPGEGEDDAEVISGGTELPGSRVDAIKENFAIICVYSLVKWISNIVFLTIGVLSIIVIAVSALYFLTAAGSDDRLKKAKNYLLYGAIGIAVAAAANLIPAIIRGFLGS